MYLTEVIPPGPRLVTKPRMCAPGYSTRWTKNAIRAPEPPSASSWTGGSRSSMSTRRPDGATTARSASTSAPAWMLPLTRLDIKTLDSFYAELRRCRDHCDGRPQLQHRTSQPHRCDEHDTPPCVPPDPDHCNACRRTCKPHLCRGLADSTVRQIQWIISGAPDRAVVWQWISVHPAEHADKPPLPHPTRNRRPPKKEPGSSSAPGPKTPTGVRSCGSP